MFSFCLRQLKKIHGRLPHNAYLMVDRPKNHMPDLVTRIREGIELAKKDGFDYVYIIESDDYYPADYFQKLPLTYDFVGFGDTIYYNIQNLTYQHRFHHRWSSLFTTAFRVDALDKFRWPPDNSINLDVRIWEYAKRKNRSYKLYSNNPCIGIKGHGFGVTAGNGHRMEFKMKDANMEFLRSMVDDEAFEFYSGLHKRLKG